MIALPNTFTFLFPFLRRLFFGRALGKPDRFFFFCKILPIVNDEVVGLRGRGTSELSALSKLFDVCAGLGMFVRRPPITWSELAISSYPCELFIPLWPLSSIPF